MADMEQDAVNFVAGREPKELAIVSIAISLKRIADILEGNPDKMGIRDLISCIKDYIE